MAFFPGAEAFSGDSFELSFEGTFEDLSLAVVPFQQEHLSNALFEQYPQTSVFDAYQPQQVDAPWSGEPCFTGCDDAFSWEVSPMTTASEMEQHVAAPTSFAAEPAQVETHVTMNNKFAYDTPYGGPDSPLITMPKDEYKQWLWANGASCSEEYLAGLTAARRRCANRGYKEKERREAQVYAATVQAELDATQANVLAMQAAQARAVTRSAALWQESAYLDQQGYF
jgi:hypothetical protein